MRSTKYFVCYTIDLAVFNQTKKLLELQNMDKN